MFQFLRLIVRNAVRSKLRTSLTWLAVTLLVMTHAFISTVTKVFSDSVTSHSSAMRLIVMQRYVIPGIIPVNYLSRLAAVPGVEDWTPWHIYMGGLDDRGHLAQGFATRIDNFQAMHPDTEQLDPAVFDAWKREKTGAVVSPLLMKQMNWKLGGSFTMFSISHPGKDLTFKIIGVLPTESWGPAFFLRRDYFEDAVGVRDAVNVVWLRVGDEQTGLEVARTIERMFENSSVALQVETESSGSARFSGRFQSLISIIQAISLVLLVNMLVILSNSINISVRERQKEMAILKAIGFPPRYVIALVVGEAMLVATSSGLLGSGFAWLICQFNEAGLLPARSEYLAMFPVTPRYLWDGAWLGAMIGFAASIVPAVRSGRISAANVFARVT